MPSNFDRMSETIGYLKCEVKHSPSGIDQETLLQIVNGFEAMREELQDHLELISDLGDDLSALEDAVDEHEADLDKLDYAVGCNNEDVEQIAEDLQSVLSCTCGVDAEDFEEGCCPFCGNPYDDDAEYEPPDDAD